MVSVHWDQIGWTVGVRGRKTSCLGPLNPWWLSVQRFKRTVITQGYHDPFLLPPLSRQHQIIQFITSPMIFQWCSSKILMLIYWNVLHETFSTIIYHIRISCYKSKALKQGHGNRNSTLILRNTLLSEFFFFYKRKQSQCLNNGIDGGFSKDVLLDFMLIPTATFPLFWNIYCLSLLYFYFPLLFLRCSVCHCSYRFWNNSKSKAVWAVLLLTALSLWTVIKEGSHQSHDIGTMQSSAPLKVCGGLAHRREKT